MCQLAGHISYDSYWPIRKIHLRCTPHKVIYHDQSNIYALIVSNKVPRTEAPPPPPQQQGEDE